MIENIKKSYIKSKEKFNDVDKSPHWEKIINKKKFDNLEDLENFRNNALSYGHDDSEYYDKERFDKEIELIIDKIGEKYLYENLKKKNIGNLKNTFLFKDISIDPGDIHLINFLFELDKYVFNHLNVKTICEIGGGYGGLAEKIINKYQTKYILIDLPETNILSTYYLYKNFPEKKFLIYSDLVNDEINNKHLSQHDIIILPPNVTFKDVNIELFINTRSMMEMRMSTIIKYFELINNHITDNGFFFNVNRYIKFRAGEPIFLKDYPYDNNWKIINSSKSFNQDWIHQIIAQREINANYNNLKIELKKIEKETKKYLQPDEYRYLDKNYFKKKNLAINLIKKFLYIFGKKIFGKNYNKFKQIIYKLINKISF